MGLQSVISNRLADGKSWIDVLLDLASADKRLECGGDFVRLGTR